MEGNRDLLGHGLGTSISRGRKIGRTAHGVAWLPFAGRSALRSSEDSGGERVHQHGRTAEEARHRDRVEPGDFLIGELRLAGLTDESGVPSGMRPFAWPLTRIKMFAGRNADSLSSFGGEDQGEEMTALEAVSGRQSRKTVRASSPQPNPTTWQP